MADHPTTEATARRIAFARLLAARAVADRTEGGIRTAIREQTRQTWQLADTTTMPALRAAYTATAKLLEGIDMRLNRVLIGKLDRLTETFDLAPWSRLAYDELRHPAGLDRYDESPTVRSLRVDGAA